MVIAASADVSLVLDGNGVILDVAFGETDFTIEGHEDWPGVMWTDVVSPDSRAKVEALIHDAATGAPTRWRQLNHRSGSDITPVQFVAMRLGQDDRIVAIGRDMRAVALLQQQLLRAQQAMEREYERFRHSETRYRLLFQVSSEAVLVVDTGNRSIVEANGAAAALLGEGVDRLVGSPLLRWFDPESNLALESMISAVRSHGRPQDVSVRSRLGDRALTASSHLFLQEEGSYCLLRLRPAGPAAQSIDLSESRSRVIEVIERLPDGFVIADESGEVLAVNRAFLAMTRLVSEQQAMGQPLDRWLVQPGIGFSGLLANLRQQQSVRLFATKLEDEYGDPLDVEISAVTIDSERGQHFGFVIRDVSRRLVPAPSSNGDLQGAVKHMAELVGRVSLKEIVRETTEVIERLCIEAALDLTGDNRASAAEMLGLSRQSLYVKMRRFGVTDVENGTRQ